LLEYYKQLPKFNVNTDHVIVQELLLDINGNQINQEYKFYIHNGKVQIINVVNNILNKTTRKRIPFDINWNRIAVYSCKTEPLDVTITKPSFMDDLITIAQDLANFFYSHVKLSFIRVDVYMTNNGVRFGEFAYTVNAGTGYTPEYESIIEEWINQDYNSLKI